jgi:glycosyltransferase involved in cell wall biosynthesis
MAKDLGISDSVRFLGLVDRKDLPKVYSAADLFVLPTLREGMPLVILEAAASGLPIVTTKVSGIPEIIDEKCAVFVPRKDSTSVSKAVIRILRNSSQAAKMGKASRQAALRLSKPKITEKYGQLYAKVAGF